MIWTRANILIYDFYDMLHLNFYDLLSKAAYSVYDRRTVTKNNGAYSENTLQNLFLSLTARGKLTFLPNSVSHENKFISFPVKPL